METGSHDYRGVEKEGVCITRVRQGPVCFVLCDSMKLYLAQVKAGTGVREGGAGERMKREGRQGRRRRGAKGSNTSVQAAAQPSALS